MDSSQAETSEESDQNQPSAPPQRNLPCIYEDGWDFGTMQKRARAQIPQIPKKKTSTWIAIVYHFIARSADIPRTNGFQFIKAHPRITAKTLRYAYFSRHPLEELYLTFNGIPLHDHVRVGQLWKASPYHDRLVVLRAVEGEMTEEEEEYAAEALEILETGTNQPGANHGNPISLDSEEDVDSSSESEKEELIGAHCDVNESSESENEGEMRAVKRLKITPPKDHATSLSTDDTNTMGLPSDIESASFISHVANHPPECSVEAKPEKNGASITDDDEDGDDEMPSHPTSSNKRKRGSNSRQTSEIQNIDSTDISGPRSRHRSPLSEEEEYYGERDSPNLPEELLARMEDFADVTKHALMNSAILLCEVCGKQMTLMPWTRFDENHGPLCTYHSRLYLEQKGFDAILDDFNNEVEHATDEKSRFDEPNMDYDFPADLFPEQYEQAQNHDQHAFNNLDDTYTYAMNVEEHVRPDSPSLQLFNDMERHFNNNPSTDYDALFNVHDSPAVVANLEADKQTIAPNQLFHPDNRSTRSASQSSGDVYLTYERNALDSPFFTSPPEDQTKGQHSSLQSPDHHITQPEQDSDDESSASEPEYLAPSGHFKQDFDNERAEQDVAGVQDDSDEVSDDEFVEDEALVDAAAKDDSDDEDYQE